MDAADQVEHDRSLIYGWRALFAYDTRRQERLWVMTGGERIMPAKVVKVLPDSELSVRLRDAETSGEPVLVDTGEGVYTLFVSQRETAPQDVFAHYDPQAAIRGLQALERALAGVDRDKLRRDLREQRAQDSSGRPA